MRVVRGTDAPSEPMDAANVVGPASRRDLGSYEEPEGSALLVTFPAGARSHWHRHPGGQFLYITEGSGRVGTRDGEVAEVAQGDLVYAPPDEEHWHGASEGDGVTHLALSFGATEWLGPTER